MNNWVLYGVLKSYCSIIIFHPIIFNTVKWENNYFYNKLNWTTVKILRSNYFRISNHSKTLHKLLMKPKEKYTTYTWNFLSILYILLFVLYNNLRFWAEQFILFINRISFILITRKIQYLLIYIIYIPFYFYFFKMRVHYFIHSQNFETFRYYFNIFAIELF